MSGGVRHVAQLSSGEGSCETSANSDEDNEEAPPALEPPAEAAAAGAAFPTVAEMAGVAADAAVVDEKKWEANAALQAAGEACDAKPEPHHAAAGSASAAAAAVVVAADAEEEEPADAEGVSAHAYTTKCARVAGARPVTVKLVSGPLYRT